MPASDRFSNEITITPPLTAQRLAEIDERNGHPDDLTDSLGRNSAEQHRRELLAEVKRLNTRLSEYVGWEPTVREEYEHACAERDEAELAKARRELRTQQRYVEWNETLLARRFMQKAAGTWPPRTEERNA